MESRLITCGANMVYQKVRRCCYDTNDGKSQEIEHKVR